MKSLGENNVFLKYGAQIIAWTILIIALYCCVWTFYYTETGNGDNVEHLHATWLIAYGKVPYRDFFQHHNPLLWYIFAPIVRNITNALTLLDFGHAVGMCAGVLTFFVVYKICRRFFDVSSLATLASLLTLCPIHYYIFCSNYNPDTFMAFAFAVGIYFLFEYWQKGKLIALCIAMMSFFMAFMFTQKILILLGILGIISLYMFYKRNTPIEHIFYALLLPLWCFVLFLVLLYNNGILEVYWKSNYTFNIIMQQYYGNKKINVAEYQMMLFSGIMAIISIICFFKKGDVFYKIIAILFMLELPQRCFYFTIAPYYLLPLMIFIACLNSVLIDKIIKKYFILIYIFLAVAGYYLYLFPSHYLPVRGQNRNFARFIAQNVTPCDYMISSYLGNQSIISKDPHYYWSLLGHVDMAGEETGIAPHPNLSLLVEQYKPKLLFGGIYWSSYEQNRGHNVFVQQIDQNLIDKYYLPTRFSDFYMLKYEYRHKNCHYDEKKGEWRYAD